MRLQHFAGYKSWYMAYDDVSGGNLVLKDIQIPSGIYDVVVYLLFGVQSVDGDVPSINVKVTM